MEKEGLEILEKSKILADTGLTYDDVLLVPQKSDITSRKDVNISSMLTPKIRLNTPIVSANMDTVTESRMAVAMAREGGIGIIHRFLTIQQQVEEVLKVKRSESVIIERPYSITPDQTLREAKEFMNIKDINGLLVVNNDSKLVGIITNRDVKFQDNENLRVSEVMTKNPVTAPIGTGIEAARKILQQHRIEKLPLVDEHDNVYGLITAKDIEKKDKFPFASKDKKGRLMVGAAIGVKKDYIERAEKLIEARADLLVVDIAHGHHELEIEVIKKLKKTFGDNTQIMGGNVATYDGAYDLVSAGADAVKAGVGGGCFAAGTRILMSNGTYKNIEEVKAGDRVINMNGEPVSVKKSFYTGIKIVSKIRNSVFYDDTYVTPDHKYWTGNLKTSNIKTLHKKGWLELVQSKTNPYISEYEWKQVCKLKHEVLLIPREINFEINKCFEIELKKSMRDNLGEEYNYKKEMVLKPSYELGYIFGMFLAGKRAAQKWNLETDSVEWCFGKNEIDTANKLIKCIIEVFDKECRLKYLNNTIRIILYYKPFVDFLQSFIKKSGKHLPSRYLIKDRNYLYGLFDGLLDGSGNREKDRKICFFNTSKKLIELFNVVSYLLTGFFPNNSKNKIKLEKHGTENFKQIFVSKVINTSAKKLNDNYQTSKLMEYEEKNMYTKVYDLEIECPTHSFIANNAIVHNSICVTRIVTGAGFPQLSAIMETSKIYEEYGIPLNADGGIKVSGDLAKAVGAGANTVMLGGLLSGTEESPGKIIIKEGRRYKIIRGMAGFGAANARKQTETGKDADLSDVVPEGVEGTVPYRGYVSEVLFHLVGGLRSGMSYCGARTIEEMRTKSKFVRITASGIRESKPHDINVVK